MVKHLKTNSSVMGAMTRSLQAAGFCKTGLEYRCSVLGFDHFKIMGPRNNKLVVSKGKAAACPDPSHFNPTSWKNCQTSCTGIHA